MNATPQSHTVGTVAPQGHPACRAASFVTLLLLIVLGGSTACGEPPESDPKSTVEREPRVLTVGFERETVIKTSVLRFELMGTRRLVPQSARVIFQGKEGAYADLDTYFSGRIDREGDVGDIIVEVDVGKTLWPQLQPSSGEGFKGSIIIELYDDLGLLGRGRIEQTAFQFESMVEPTVDSISAGDVHVNEAIEVDGSGFLRPEEGTSWAVFEDGKLTRPDGSTKDLTGERIGLQWKGRRDQAFLPLDPSVFGVLRSSFQGTLRFENELTDGGLMPGSGGHKIDGQFERSYIAKLSPQSGSRGQKITVIGRGFVGTDDKAGYGMFLRYEGTFRPDDDSLDERDFTGGNAIERIPDRLLGEDEAEQSIWYDVEDRKLTGLGATPGTFDGTIRPVLFDENGEQEGVPWEGEFRVLPTKQIIYLKYLPAFSKALEKYGLRNIERDIRDRIRAVIERDYADYHVEVREEKPDDFIDYATVELGGPDPSGTRAFGYDNSFNGVAKDTGNLFLADYLGGVNADAAAEFNNPYGGIFIESFTFFSPTLSDHPNTSEAFDRILKPFMPKLGGKPVRGTEWPDGPRHDKIARAIQMVGSVIGNTVTHEVGHSLGMTFVRGDFVRPQNTFHNEIPGPYIMDGGADRPFAERAELDGADPAGFNALNKQYLDRILPKPE